MEHLYGGMFQYLNLNIWILIQHKCLFAYIKYEQCFRLNSALFMFEYVVVEIFLYLGVGTFVWRNVSIFELNIWMLKMFNQHLCLFAYVIFVVLTKFSFVWVWIFKCWDLCMVLEHLNREMFQYLNLKDRQVIYAFVIQLLEQFF